MAVTKIAVLGGGMGSLTAVFQLTSDPNWQQNYDITVYQMGWRLGGKGASGRNAEVGERIEEHGLHLWFGFYDNAFNLIQQVYKENNRPPGTPLSTWEEAFTGYDFICLEEHINGEWLHWPFVLPTNSMIPGDSNPPLTIQGFIVRLVDYLCDQNMQFTQARSAAVAARIQAHTASDDFTRLRQKFGGLIADADKIAGNVFSDAGNFLLHAAASVAAKGEYSILKELLTEFVAWLKGIGNGLQDSDATIRHFFIIVDLCAVSILGMINDDVINQGFNCINKYDYREWLGRWGAAQITIDSALVQAVYGLVFGGDGQYTFEAGTALRGLLRLGFTYKGHVYYRMMAGMGDAIFGPVYEVLTKRGVKFEFFSKVTNLGLDANNNISTISIDVQATLATGFQAYYPLVTVNNLTCWPNFPNTKYLAQGPQIDSDQPNLESYYSTWQPTQPIAPRTLQLGVDFNLVILGISIGALPTVAKELIAANTAWQNMVKNVVPISTIAYQLWLSCSIGDMKWPYINDGLALLGSYREPYDTWADMSDLVDRENWPAGYKPQNIAYFCGPTPQPNADQILKNAMQSNFSDPTFPDAQYQMAQEFALQYLQQLSAHIWPGIWQGQNGFDFSKLIDLKNGQGQARFIDQFFRANIDPTELYVMSFTGSSQFRLKTDQTASFKNLYITGDWIDNGLNAGCIEATVMAGLQTARAISGENIVIAGEKDI